MKPHASLSLDLDNAWSYLKTRNDESWQSFPSYLDAVVPDSLATMDKHGLALTYFIVGRDAALPGNRAAMELLGASRHEMGNHSYEHEPWITGRTVAEIAAEIGLAQDAIAATGRRPCGFRSPGYAIAAGCWMRRSRSSLRTSRSLGRASMRAARSSR
jgi:peptidoglycan/xylan/chitin deacetylase (PgdA/CDA1 family)